MDKLRKGWEQHLLGELFEFKNGLNTDKSKYGAGYKFVNVMDVFNNDYLTEDKIIGSVQITEKQLFEYKLKYGDVLFNRTSEVPEEIAYSTVYLDDKNAVFGGFVIRARSITDKLNEKFLIYLFQSDKFRTQAIKCGQGAIRANIGQKDLAKIRVDIPSLPEQIKIAEILSTWDNAIQTTEKQITNSQQQKKSLMQMLLSGEKRVSGFSGEWKNYILEHLGNTFTGLTGKSKNNFGKGKPYITYMNVFKNMNIKLNEFELVEIFDDEKQNPIQYGDIFFTTSSETAEEVGMSSVLLDKPLSYVYLNSFCFGFRLHNFDILLPEYAQFLFRIEQVRKQIRILAQGATRYNLSKTKLMKLNIELPVIQEQQKIAEILTTANQEIETLQRKLKCLKLEKRALMQRLL